MNKIVVAEECDATGYDKRYDARPIKLRTLIKKLH